MKTLMRWRIAPCLQTIESEIRYYQKLQQNAPPQSDMWRLYQSKIFALYDLLTRLCDELNLEPLNPTHYGKPSLNP